MRIPRRRRPDLLVSYEMNVHRGETLEQLYESMEQFVLPIRAKVARTEPFGMAPRIGRGLIGELRTKKSRQQLRDWLEERELYWFSINAFPLEDFHSPRVKEQVYSPPWTRAERARLTRQICSLLAELLPEGEVGTVSTLGGTYRSWGHGPREFAAMARQYLAVVRHLIELQQDTGRTILLTAEPEPDTTFEAAEDVITVFRDYMLPLVPELIAQPLGLSKSRAESLVRTYFTVNLDVCHQSVLFRDPVREWKQLEREGLRVGKLHLTNALALPNPSRSPQGLAELSAFDEPRYLHQFAIQRQDGSVDRGADLPELGSQDLEDAREVRCHFHVPLSRSRMGRLHTTRPETAQALAYALSHPDPPHLVVETYTWPLLDGGEGSSLVQGITRELRWVLDQIGS